MKAIGAYELNNFAFSANGAAAVTDTLGTVPTVTKLDLGTLTPATNPLNGHLRRLAYYNTRLPDAKLQALTA